MIALGLLAMGAALACGAFILLLVRDRTYVPSPAYAPSGQPKRDVAVVYYSRSGHSEAVAREIARLSNAPIARIDADYPLSWSGWRKAAADARAGSVPEIRVAHADIDPPRRLILVGPTWLFRPAPPLWTYVERSDLAGKDVVLVLTGNSRYRTAEIEAFARRVEARGGRLVRHLFLRRGRIFWQKSREELLAEARAQLGGGMDLPPPAR